MKIELCAASIEAIKIAKKYNFDRIELCQNLEQGGVTPSPGMIEYAIAYGLETHVLIRPRSGGFFYTQDEVEIMLRDILECANIGASGVVVGALNEYGLVDEENLKLFVDKADGLEVTFHRAFDDSYEWQKNMESLINCGVKRILTSGLANKAEMGVPILAEMKAFAGDAIEIMPGGGINAVNVSKIITEVQPDAVHFSGTVKTILDEESKFSESVLAIDEARVKRILEAIGL